MVKVALEERERERERVVWMEGKTVVMRPFPEVSLMFMRSFMVIGSIWRRGRSNEEREERKRGKGRGREKVRERESMFVGMFLRVKDVFFSSYLFFLYIYLLLHDYEKFGRSE